MGQKEASLTIRRPARDFVEMGSEENVRSLGRRGAGPMVDDGGQETNAACRIGPFAELVEDDQ